MIASGTWGTCHWEIDDDGGLVVGAGTGSNVGFMGSSPWNSWKTRIVTARFEPTVYSPSSCGWLFYQCANLVSVDLTDFVTTGLTYNPSFFEGCSSLVSVDMSGIDMTLSSNVQSMFFDCPALEELNIDTEIKASAIRTNMYYNTPKLRKITLHPTSRLGSTGFTSVPPTTPPYTGTWINKDPWTETTANLATWWEGSEKIPGTYEWRKDTDVPPDPLIASGTWGTCPWEISAAGELVIGAGTGADILSAGSAPWNAYAEQVLSARCNGTVILPPRPMHLFRSFSFMTSLDVSGFDTSNLIDMSGMFNYCNSLTSLDLSNFDTSKVTSMYLLFNSCGVLSSVDISSFDTSNVLDMSYMFNACRSLISLDLSHFDTSNVTNMSYMFASCSSLRTLDVSSFDTSNVTNMLYMLSYCASLIVLDVSSFDTSNVTNMSYMFASSFVESLDLSGFDTRNATNISSMFRNAVALTSLDLSSFDTSKVTNFSSMFYGLTQLTFLDISNFDTSKGTNLATMFNSASKLESLRLGPKTLLPTTANLPKPKTTSPYTGQWVNKSRKLFAPADLLSWYDGSRSGLYEWAKDTDVFVKEYLDDAGLLAVRDIIKVEFDALEARIRILEQ